MSTKQPLADGSGVPNSRAQSAFVRTIDACMTVERAADRVLAEMDHATIPGSGIISGPLDDDDSLVVAIQEARGATTRLGT
jgi:hypothetical protein